MRLAVRELQAWHGRSQALFGMDLDIEPGETVALIGRNGAGKSTTLQAVIGMPTRRSGSIVLGGRETVGLSPHRIARLGVALVPQGRRIFKELTVEENLRTGVRAGAGDGPWSMQRLFEVFPLLAAVRSSKGGWLSGGEQQVLAIARALISDPKLLLLDEPSEGLAPRVVETLAEQLLQVQRGGLTILLAEQHLGLVRELATRAYVIDRGVIRAQGAPAQLLADERIRHAYLSL